MVTYTITLSDAEDKALGWVALSQQQWIDNAVHERCRIAMDEILKDEFQRKIEAGETISGSKDDIIMGAPIKSAAERHAEFEATLEER